MPPSVVRLHKHPPERRSAGVTVSCGACCCCCCCCLHTIGGLLGAAAAPNIGSGAAPTFYDAEAGRSMPLIEKPGPSGVALHWQILLALLALGLLVGMVMGDRGSLIVTGIVLLVIMPALQLAAVLLAFFIMLAWPRPDRSYQLAQLGKVMLGLAIGTAVGIGVMALAGMVLTRGT